MEKIKPRMERKVPPAEKNKPLLAGIKSLVARKPHSAKKVSPLEGRKKKSPADMRKIIIAALGIVLLALIVIIAATATYSAVAGKAVTTPTPVPTAIPEPTPEATPDPTATPEPTITPTPGPVISNDGPFNMHAMLSAADGKCLVTLQLLKSSDPVDIGKVTIDMQCDGNVYRNVWTPKPMDWCNADNDTMLEKEEIIATIIDTSANNVPQGKPLTITVFKEGERLQEVTVLPS